MHMNIGLILESFDKFPISTIAYICLYTNQPKILVYQNSLKHIISYIYLYIYIYAVQK